MISIVTINYNNCIGLQRTLSSIQSQLTALDFEHIIIDGASTDNSLFVAEEYRAHSPDVVLKSERDLGIYNAMNKGIELAKGSHIAFLNSGDVLAHNKSINNICVEIARDQTIDLLYGDLCFVNKETEVIREWVSGDFSKSKLYWGWMPPHPMTTIRASLLQGYGKFDERFQISADYDIMLKILLRSNVCVKYLPETLVYMEAGGLSNGSINGILQSNVEVLRSWISNIGYVFPFWVFFSKPFLKILQIRKRPLK